jgi:hypothetical protein
MRDDLLHAQASVDWAASQFPDFKKRLDAWLNDNVYLAIREQPPNVPNNVVVAAEKTSLPLKFQVEAGAYINAIRSSLDIVSATLANRHCQALIDDAYFPVASSEKAFASGNYKGHKLIRALPAKERETIESLKPYKGGNDLLYALHHLDIVRKHQRLLGVDIRPRVFIVAGWGDTLDAFTLVSTGWMRSGPDETVIGLLAKNAPQPKISLTMRVSLGETAYLPHREVVTALHQLANLARATSREFA